MNRMKQICSFMSNNIAVLIIIFSVIAFFYPGGFSWATNYTTVFLGIAMFGMGLTKAFSSAHRSGPWRDSGGLLSRRNGQQCHYLCGRGRRAAVGGHDHCLYDSGAAVYAGTCVLPGRILGGSVIAYHDDVCRQSGLASGFGWNCIISYFSKAGG